MICQRQLLSPAGCQFELVECFYSAASWGCCTGRATPANAMVQAEQRYWLSLRRTLLACYVAPQLSHITESCCF